MTPSVATRSLVMRGKWTAPFIPGLVLSSAIAVLAYFSAREINSTLNVQLLDGLLVCIVLGFIVRNIPNVWRDEFNQGAFIATKRLLELAIVALGASISLSDIVANGSTLLIFTIVLAGSSMAVTWTCARALGNGSRLSVLLAVGNSICGNSAIAAVGPIIRATQSEIAIAVGFAATLGTVQVLALPFAAHVFGWSDRDYGILVGLSAYAVPQAVAAGLMISTSSAQTATLVKFIRVVLILPTVILSHAVISVDRRSLVGFSYIRSMPWFLLPFFILALLRSIGVLPDELGANLNSMSKLLFYVAMAGIGMSVTLEQTRKSGPRAMLACFVGSAFLVAGAAFGVWGLGVG